MKRLLSLLGVFKREHLPAISFADPDDSSAFSDAKVIVFEALLRLRKDVQHPFGMLIVAGWWRREWKKYVSYPDYTQNLFRQKPFVTSAHTLDDFSALLKRTIDFDGAILLDREGIVYASGVYLERMHVATVAKVLHPNFSGDLSSAFGFTRKVHMRHLAGIAASYILKGTTVFVVSEEDRSVRIFENGKIVWSTVKGEGMRK